MGMFYVLFISEVYPHQNVKGIVSVSDVNVNSFISVPMSGSLNSVEWNGGVDYWNRRFILAILANFSS